MKYIVNVSFYKFEFHTAEEAATFAYSAITSCMEDNIRVSIDFKLDEEKQPEEQPEKEEDNF